MGKFLFTLCMLHKTKIIDLVVKRLKFGLNNISISNFTDRDSIDIIQNVRNLSLRSEVVRLLSLAVTS